MRALRWLVPSRHIPRRHDVGDFLVRRVVLPWPSESGEALRLAVVSDVHAHQRWFDEASVRALVTRVNELDSLDAIVMPGDFVADDERQIDLLAPALATLAAPVFATTGNHDVSTDVDRVVDALREHGATVLRDEVHELARGTTLVGLDSMYGGRRDRRWVDDAVPDGSLAIVLGHEPQLASVHTQRLHVAGHTHHGQIRIPGVPPLYLPRFSRPWVGGLHERPGSAGWVYTSAGVGYTHLPLRLGVPSEITVIELSPEASETSVTTEASPPVRVV